MSNNHAQDRYDPPNIGSEYEEQVLHPGMAYPIRCNPLSICVVVV